MIKINDYSKSFIENYKKRVDTFYSKIQISKIKIFPDMTKFKDFFYFIHINKLLYENNDYSSWINDYILLCDAVEVIDKFFKGEKINRSVFDEKIKTISCTEYFQAKVLSSKMPPVKVVKNPDLYPTFYKSVIDDINETNTHFKEVLKYNARSINAKTRKELMLDLAIEICPYCNCTLISNFSTKKEKFYALAEIDHFLPKHKYPLFSLCLYNFIPSCKTCNQTFKGKKDVDIVYPYHDSFGDENYFNMNPLTYDVVIEVSPDSPIKEKIKNSVELFKLNERYSNHKKYNAYLANKKMFFSNISREKLIELFKSPSRSSITNEMIDTAIYGTKLKAEDDLFIPMSKFIRDVIKH